MNNKRIIITLWQARGGPQYLETFRAGADPGSILSAFLAQLVGRLGSEGFWDGDYRWGVRVSRPFGARWGVLSGTRPGDLKTKSSKHTGANGNFGHTGPGLRWEVGCGGGRPIGVARLG
jgi:hypothetical protein